MGYGENSSTVSCCPRPSYWRSAGAHSFVRRQCSRSDRLAASTYPLRVRSRTNSVSPSLSYRSCQPPPRGFHLLLSAPGRGDRLTTCPTSENDHRPQPCRTPVKLSAYGVLAIWFALALWASLSESLRSIPSAIL